MRKFSNIIEEIELCNILPQEGAYMWRGATIIQELQEFVRWSGRSLRSTSSSRFKNMWLRMVGFKEMMQI